jgi:hypothetical protein
MKDKTILFVAANPEEGIKKGGSISWEKEFKIIKRIIKNNLNLNDFCKIEIEPDSTSEDFIECLNKDKPWIIHFAGHGIKGSGEMVLVNKENLGKAIRIDDLVDELKYCNELECILFSSCYSSNIIEKTAKIVKYSIGFKDSIYGNQSLEFAKQFYKNLDLNTIESIRHAFQRTKTDIKFNRQDSFEPILKSRRSFIMKEIIKNQRVDLVKELTPAGLDELKYIKKQIELNQIDVSLLEDESFILKQNLNGINIHLNSEQKRLLEKHEFAMEILWFIKHRKDLSIELANIIFPFENEKVLRYFATELNIMFNFIEGALVSDDYSDILEEDLNFKHSNLVVDISYYKIAFDYLDKLIVKKTEFSNDFILYLRDNINYLKALIN